jgi:hypothetical protein
MVCLCVSTSVTSGVLYWGVAEYRSSRRRGSKDKSFDILRDFIDASFLKIRGPVPILIPIVISVLKIETNAMARISVDQVLASAWQFAQGEFQVLQEHWMFLMDQGRVVSDIRRPTVGEFVAATLALPAQQVLCASTNVVADCSS